MSADGRPEFDAILPARRDLRPLHISWFLHNHCNHRCSYCHESNWSGSFRWISFDDVRSFIEQVKAHFPDRQILVSMTGGEPTLWPDFERCVQYLAAEGIEIGMTSNGARPLDFFERVAPHFSWINFSFHPEFTRPEKFLNLIDRLSSLVPVSVRIMLPREDKMWRRSMEFRQTLERELLSGKIRGRIQIEMVKVVSGFGTLNTAPIGYAVSQDDELARWPSRELSRSDSVKVPYESVLGEYVTHQLENPATEVLRANDLVEAGQVNFKNWICNIGIEQLFVGADGFVFRAGCGVGSRLGRIGGHISFPNQPVRCWKTYCHCVTDIAISKVSPEWVNSRVESSDLDSTHQSLLRGAAWYRRFGSRLWDSLQEMAFELENSNQERSLRGWTSRMYLQGKRVWLTARWSRRWQRKSELQHKLS